MSIENLQTRINEGADKKLLMMIQSQLAAMRAAIPAIRREYPAGVLANETVEVVCEVKLATPLEIDGRKVKFVDATVTISKYFIDKIENALFAAAKEEARKKATDEFLSRVGSVLP